MESIGLNVVNPCNRGVLRIFLLFVERENNPSIENFGNINFEIYYKIMNFEQFKWGKIRVFKYIFKGFFSIARRIYIKREYIPFNGCYLKGET